MIVRFRNLSLRAKLFLLGLIPVVFLMYFSVIIYREKSQKVEYLGGYIEHIQQSQNIAGLVAELTRERRYSYFYILGDSTYDRLLLHRERTDSILMLLQKSKDPSFINFPQYTFLDNLDSARHEIDSFKMTTNGVMNFYTDAIFRLNLLVSTFPVNTFLKPVYSELIAQKKLSDMITYLGIIRTNIFNLLLNKKYVNETLFGTMGVYKVFYSYEKEFLLKAPATAVHEYYQRKRGTDYGETLNYINRVFQTFKIDSTFNSGQFWQISTNAMINLRQQQLHLWKNANDRMLQIYQHEKGAQKRTILFIFFAILLVIGFVIYVINHIHKLLTEIKLAASKISVGSTGLHLKKMPKGVIGNLAKSIIEIDRNNLELARAASQIGKGNFEVKITPRSEQDILGISIEKMRDNLHEFATQKDKIQREMEKLIYRREEFFSIASHELKTPVTSLKAYTQLLLMDTEGQMDTHHKTMLRRMETQISKLTSLINDLLDFSKIENDQLVLNKELFILNGLITEIISDMQPICLPQKIKFKNNFTASVYGDRERIRQVISNFISNANKYASKSNEILITIDRNGDNVICSVQDFGKGINEEEQDKIFERFYRVSGTNLNTFPGLGLGLYICKKVIEQEGGKIGVESEPGKGSTFYFELSLAGGLTTIPENYYE